MLMVTRIQCYEQVTCEPQVISIHCTFRLAVWIDYQLTYVLIQRRQTRIGSRVGSKPFDHLRAGPVI